MTKKRTLSLALVGISGVLVWGLAGAAPKVPSPAEALKVLRPLKQGPNISVSKVFPADAAGNFLAMYIDGHFAEAARPNLAWLQRAADGRLAIVGRIGLPTLGAAHGAGDSLAPEGVKWGTVRHFQHDGKRQVAVVYAYAGPTLCGPGSPFHKELAIVQIDPQPYVALHVELVYALGSTERRDSTWKFVPRPDAMKGSAPDVEVRTEFGTYEPDKGFKDDMAIRAETTRYRHADGRWLAPGAWANTFVVALNAGDSASAGEKELQTLRANGVLKSKLAEGFPRLVATDSLVGVLPGRFFPALGVFDDAEKAAALRAEIAAAFRSANIKATVTLIQARRRAGTSPSAPAVAVKEPLAKNNEKPCRER